MDVTLIFPTWTCEKECATFRYPFHRILQRSISPLGVHRKIAILMGNMILFISFWSFAS
jgi:type IV secretory pathway TrbD component